MFPTLVTLSVPALGLADAAVEALSGEDELGRVPRFALELVCRAADVGAEAAGKAIGSDAELCVTCASEARVIRGVVAELEVGAARADGCVGVRLVLASRAWLLSLGQRSRVFERLSVPAIVEAVIAASGVALALESRLERAYPVRACSVQHRESDLDFVTRLVEREGIALAIDDAGPEPKLVLCDHNEGFAAEAVREVADAVRKMKLLPRFVEVVGYERARPELRLRSRALVAPNGVGVHEVYDESCAGAEDGERAARVCAERLRVHATRVRGSARAPIAAGRRLDVAGEEVVIVAAQHRFVANAAGAPDWSTSFEALPASAPFRPERRAPEPRIYGLMGGRVALREPGETLGREAVAYRVTGVGGGLDEQLMPFGVPGAGPSAALAEGTEVAWGCIEGDPERPVITAVLAGAGAHRAGHSLRAAHGRAVLAAPGGATLELGGAVRPGLGEVEGLLGALDADVAGMRAVPEVMHHSESSAAPTDETTTTDTWMRMGVPHSGTGTRAWSYWRMGEAATATSLTVAIGDSSATFTESASQCFGLTLNSYDATGLAGFFDYTDKNRTALTKGNWEEIVKGEGRLAVHGGASNSDPNYELRVTGSRSQVTSKVPVYTFTDGAQLGIFSGFKLDAKLGGNVDTTMGMKITTDLGFLVNLTAGYKMDFIFADSFEFRRGEELGSSSTLDKRAKEKVQFSIHSGFGNPGASSAVAAAAAVIATGVLAGVGAAMDLDDVQSGIMTGVSAGAMALAIAAARATSAERDLEDGDPILSLDKTKGIGVLRSDDWLLMLSPTFAVLGKNEGYGAVKSVSDLTADKAAAALLIKEVGTPATHSKIILQAGATADKMATITMEKGVVTIVADTIEVKGATDPAKSTITLTGDVTIDGDVTLKKKLTVTGESAFNNKLTIKQSDFTTT